MKSCDGESLRRMLDTQWQKVYFIGMILMLAPPYLVGTYLFAFVPSLGSLNIVVVFLGGWLATISFWMFFGERFVVKQWFPELFEAVKK